MKDSVMSSPVAASGTSPALTKQSRCEDQPTVQASLTERFDILKFLGTSANSFCFAALDLATGRPVRLKVLSDDAAADGAQKELFYLEAAAAAKLSHQNITRTTEAEELGGIHFCTIEQRPNVESLRALLDMRSWLEIDVATSIALQVADALDYAHRMGVLHLNLDPANILIDGDGRVLVTDFGISADQELAWTHADRSGRHCLQYTSPEQIQGPHADSRSDLYSLGIILFEMLTDRVPFDSTDTGLVKRKHLTQAPHPPQLFRQGISNYLSALVLTLLEKNPEWRFRTSAQLQTALSKVTPADLAYEDKGRLTGQDKNEDSSQLESQAVEEVTQSAELDFIDPQTDLDASGATADNILPVDNISPVQDATGDTITHREFFEPPTIIKIDPPPDRPSERRTRIEPQRIEPQRIEPQRRVTTARENIQPLSLYVSSSKPQGRRQVLMFLAIILVILLLVSLIGRNYLSGFFLTASSGQQNNLPDALATNPEPAGPETGPPVPADQTGQLETENQVNKSSPGASTSSIPAQDKVAPVKKRSARRWRSSKTSQSARLKAQARRKTGRPGYLKRVRRGARMFEVGDRVKPK